MIIFGEKDFVNFKIAKKFCQENNIKFHLIPKCTHDVQLDKYQKTHQKIKEFLN